MIKDALYYRHLAKFMPPPSRRLGGIQQVIWQSLAIMSLILGVWYLSWRFTTSFNPEAPVFSWVIFLAEVVMFASTVLFAFDIWEEKQRRRYPPSAALPKRNRSIDILIATYDEEPALVFDTILAAQRVRVPSGWTATISVLDDGAREEMRMIARAQGVKYVARTTNEGFKAGNLKNALWSTDGDFILIADADTRLFPSILENALGYFADPKVAWVQTPHWFCDVPPGKNLNSLFPKFARQWITSLFGAMRMGRDPYCSEPDIFFDVVQRRRDRNNASFCCGAGSIHRREALFQVALENQSTEKGALPSILQPFVYHVSEDILTSIHMHNAGWKSVYHPEAEAQMLSPQSVEAWAAQRLKYSGGSLDIIFNRFPLILNGMPWKMKLHYFATFSSYLTVVPLCVLLLCPVFTLFTGIAPVASYSFEFFLHLLPFLLALELALVVGMKGHDVHASRIGNLSNVPFVLLAMAKVLRGQKIGFKPTPKTLKDEQKLRFLWPHFAVISVFATAAAFGVWAHMNGSRDHTLSLLVVNLFWLTWNGLGFFKVVGLFARSTTRIRTKLEEQDV